MKIRTTYVPSTSSRGARIRARVVGTDKTLTVDYPYGAVDPHHHVAWTLAQRVEPTALRVQMERVHPAGYIFRVDKAV